MQVETYLHFQGQCEAALNYYKQHLDSEILFMMRFKDSPAAGDTPADWQDKIMHATFRVGATCIMASDGMPGKPHKEAHGFSMSVSPDTLADAERIFAALAEKGSVTMPLQKTFFALRFGSLIDQFGTPWMVHLEK
jgi:PhnB protein